MSVTVLKLARAGIALLTSEKGRSAITTILFAILVPIILIVMAVMGMADGAAEHNRAAVVACFDSSVAIPGSVAENFKNHILEMRECFAALDTVMTALEYPEDEDIAPVDSILVKSIYYGLMYEKEHLSLSEEGASSFVDCFVTYEERTKEVPVEQEDDDEGSEPQMETVTYQVAIPITSLQTVFQNVAQSMGRSISLENQSMCMEVYYLVRYGDASRAGNSDDLIAILVDGESEYIGGAAGSPFADDWRGHVTSEFVNRVNPLTGRAEHHNGIDLAAPHGTPIRAVASGTVVLARYGHPSYGNYLVIDHGGGTTTLYAHCSALTVSTGQTVTAGDQVAKVGSTGDSTGNHLHLEVRVGGNLVNPRTFLQ